MRERRAELSFLETEALPDRGTSTNKGCGRNGCSARDVVLILFRVLMYSAEK